MLLCVSNMAAGGWFETVVSVAMRSALFLDITQRRLVNLYRRFGKRVGPIFNGQEVHAAWSGNPLPTFRDNVSHVQG